MNLKHYVLHYIGTEFQAVFLSTTEPVDDDGNTTNPTKSPCDPYVFNTVLTRSKSLVVAVGSPVALLRIEDHMVKKYGKKARCWSTYMKLCLDKNTFRIPAVIEVNDERKKEFTSELRTKLSNRVSKAFSDTTEKVSTTTKLVSGITRLSSANAVGEKENLYAGYHSSAATSDATHPFPGKHNQPTFSMSIPLPANDLSALQLKKNQSHVKETASQRPIPASLSLSHKVSSVTPNQPGKSGNQNKTSPLKPPAIPAHSVETALADSSSPSYRKQPGKSGNLNLPWMKTSPISPPAIPAHPMETALVDLGYRRSGNLDLPWMKTSPFNPPAIPMETDSSSLGYRRHVVSSMKRSPGKNFKLMLV